MRGQAQTLPPRDMLALAPVAWPTVLVQAAAAAARASNQRSAMPSKGPAGSAAARRE